MKLTISELKSTKCYRARTDPKERFGDAKHLDPDGLKGDNEVPGWKESIPAEEAAGRLAMLEYFYVKSWFPEIDSLQISPDFTTILIEDGTIRGKDAREAFADYLRGGRDPRVTGIGETTLLRAIVTRLSQGASIGAGRPDTMVSYDDRQTVQRGNSRGAGNTVDLLRSGAKDAKSLAVNILYSSPSGIRSFDFGTTGDMGSKNQLGFNFDAVEKMVTGPRAKAKANALEQMQKAPVKGKEILAKRVAKLEGLQDLDLFAAAAVKSLDAEPKPNADLFNPQSATESAPVSPTAKFTAALTVQKDGWERAYQKNELANEKLVTEYLDAIQSLPDGAMKIHYDGIMLKEPLETKIQRILALEKEYPAIVEQSQDLQSDRVKKKRAESAKKPATITTNPPQNSTSAPNPTQPLGDFGETLAVRKNRPINYSAEISEADITKLPLAKLWPKTDVDAIADIPTAAIAHTLRENLPAKPRADWKLRRWAEKLRAARASMQTIETLGAEETLRQINRISPHLAAQARILITLPREQWGRVESLTHYPDAYIYERTPDGSGTPGNKIPTPRAEAVVDGKRIEAKTIPELAEKLQALFAEKTESLGSVLAP